MTLSSGMQHRSPDRVAVTGRILEGYPKEQRYTLAMLQDIQKEFQFIPRESMELIADYLELPLSKIYSLATFYKALSLRPKGKHVIKICDGTACHIRSSQMLANELYTLLKIRPGETTEDGQFSIEMVNCLGACAIAPVIVIDETFYGKVTPAKLQEIIAQYGDAFGQSDRSGGVAHE
ncbi:NADH-quinone oxidoreductase subunit NuoE [Heliobacterium mobile]|nr:NADH-quinone oxidoreductase subunit NuoE [Heliobacterium mobile]